MFAGFCQKPFKKMGTVLFFPVHIRPFDREGKGKIGPSPFLDGLTGSFLIK
jgi:hypothetical protein